MSVVFRMRAIFLSSDELHSIRNALEHECSSRLEEFERSQVKPDVLSQQRAVRAAKDARRLHKVLARIDACLKQSLG